MLLCVLAFDARSLVALAAIEKHSTQDMIDVCFLPDYDLTFFNAALSDMSKLLYKFQIMISSSEMV